MKASTDTNEQRWLKWLELAYEPFWSLPPWVVACYWTCTPSTADVSRKEWQGFLLLLERDVVARDAIDTMVRIGAGRDQVEASVFDSLELFRAKLQKAPVLAALARARERRARRLQMRESGLTGDLMGRPSDEDFLLEALPPKVK